MNYFGVFVSRMPSESVSGELVWAFLVNQLINQEWPIINDSRKYELIISFIRF